MDPAHNQMDSKEYGGYLAKKDSLSLSFSLFPIILIYFKMQSGDTSYQWWSSV